MHFIGVLFNTAKMTLEVIPERLREIKLSIIQWQEKETISIKEIQSL